MKTRTGLGWNVIGAKILATLKRSDWRKNENKNKNKNEIVILSTEHDSEFLFNYFLTSQNLSNLCLSQFKFASLKIGLAENVRNPICNRTDKKKKKKMIEKIKKDERVFQMSED